MALSAQTGSRNGGGTLFLRVSSTARKRASNDSLYSHRTLGKARSNGLLLGTTNSTPGEGILATLLLLPIFMGTLKFWFGAIHSCL